MNLKPKEKPGRKVVLGGLVSVRERQPKVREMKRTCTRCGGVRYLPVELAQLTPTPKLQLAGARLSAAGSRASLLSLKTGGKETFMQRLENRDERVMAAARCPSCGSMDFTEEPA